MKKTVSLILALILTCTTLFSLTSCFGSSADVDGLNAKIAELTEQLNATNSKISTLEAEKAAQADEITTLKADIKVLEAEKATLAANKAILEAEKSLLEEEITDLEAEIARLQALMDGNSNALLEEIAKIEAQVESLEAEVATLKSDKAKLEAELSGEIAELESQIESLEAEVATLKSDKAKLEAELSAEIAELEEQVKSLQAEVATLKSDKAKLESQITSLNAQISTLDAEKATLTARVTELESSIAAKNTEIANLNSTVSALTTEKNNLIAEKNALVTENNELKEENKELTDLVASLRNCLKGIHTYVEGFCTTCGKEGESAPAYTREGDYIYFGEYPQTIKADDVMITDTTDSRGYHLGSDGSYYAKVTATPYGSNYTFSTGVSVTNGNAYYFRVEPIRWRILSEENGEALILCDSVIAKVEYQPNYYIVGDNYYTSANGAPEGTYANNYKYSNVRKWLNSDFYEIAFNNIESALILITEVDNGASSIYDYGYTGITKDTYLCENTNDKIFLLSRNERTNDDYGFVGYSVLTSDYSRATGTFMYAGKTSYYYGNGEWMLRSPCDFSSHEINNVDYAGREYISNMIYYNTLYGVVPALRIKL